MCPFSDTRKPTRDAISPCRTDGHSAVKSAANDVTTVSLLYSIASRGAILWPPSLLRSSVIFGACRTSFYVADGDAFLKPDFEGSAGAGDRLSEGHLTSARPGPVDGTLDFWRRSTETVGQRR